MPIPRRDSEKQVVLTLLRVFSEMLPQASEMPLRAEILLQVSEMPLRASETPISDH